MRKNPLSADEPWCFPEAPPPPADRTRRWCFPEGPPRVPVSDPDEPWCFPDGPHRPGGRMRTQGRRSARRS
ncbi:MAG TPA: hypothetical protein VGY96_15015 [Streptosporangiaceae bacterium]|jgi:hypothetical protein|nr:hypothetical protein [Streptosporangiaceae bacterium]